MTRALSTLGLLAIAVLTTPGLLLVWLSAPVLDHFGVDVADDYIERASLVLWGAAVVAFGVTQWLR